MSKLFFDGVEKTSPLGGSKLPDFRNRILIEPDREHRDYNYSLVRRRRQP